MDQIQGGHAIFDLQSHRVITRWKFIVKHIEEMAAHEKATSLKFKKISGVIYYIDSISGVEYEY